MARRGKKYVEIRKRAKGSAATLKEAIAAVKKLSYSKFDGTVELHLAVNLPKDKEPKSIKGSVSLPHSTSTKAVKIAVFTNKENEKAAKDAGADLTDMEKLVADVKSGKIEFDVAIATPDVMPKIAALGKELGPRGLMPNPKTGTVTTDIATTVGEYKKGKFTFAADEQGGMHFPVGKVKLEDAQIEENVMACLQAAADVLGKRVDGIVRKAHLAPTMGPSVEFEFQFTE